MNDSILESQNLYSDLKTILICNSCHVMTNRGMTECEYAGFFYLATSKCAWFLNPVSSKYERKTSSTPEDFLQYIQIR